MASGLLVMSISPEGTKIKPTVSSSELFPGASSYHGGGRTDLESGGVMSGELLGSEEEVAVSE